MATETKHTKLTEQLVEDFGANASYAETLLDRYLSSPTLVDDAWKGYFADLLSSPAANGIIEAKLGKNGELENENGQAIATPKLTVASTPSRNPAPVSIRGDSQEVLRGGPKKIVENMEQSLGVPTATSIRIIPVKLLEENRRLINQALERKGGGKASFTHVIAYALIDALKQFPQLNDAFALTNEGPARVKRSEINLGLAIDLQKKDGSRTLLVPNIKKANTLNFAQFLKAYDDTIKRARTGKLDVADFADTTVSLTNPGTIGTVGSVPRLMAGQSLIIATGAIEYPAEYQASSPETLNELAIGKVIQMTSTYDHRIVQGAESGAMLARIAQLLMGEDGFYDKMFADLGIRILPYKWSVDKRPTVVGFDRQRQAMEQQSKIFELINAYRVRGHLLADLDPLQTSGPLSFDELELATYGLTIWDLDREFVTGGLAGKATATLRDILEILHRSYTSTVGIEYRHIQSREEKEWLRVRLEGEPQPISNEIRKAMLWKILSAEQFEHFLHNNYLGQKRFSVEGLETVIAMLDQLIEKEVELGVDDIVLGMSHRGRLTVLANVLGTFCERIFTSFEGSIHPNFPADEGDVKYHQGMVGFRDTQGKHVALTLSPNPSHLEFVDPVVEGMVRAKQDALALPLEERWGKVLPVLLHGDAAFAGQGIVMETLNLASLRGYRTGGTIHIIVNNQIGFTTTPDAGRSTPYPTDIARMTQLPIFHINGDDPDAAYRALMLAIEFRSKFHKDVVLDVVGFRRLGHNETDEPSYTQPLMYARVKAHHGVRELYAEKLVKDKVVTAEEVKGLLEERNKRYNDSMLRAKEVVKNLPPVTHKLQPISEIDGSEVIETAIDRETVRTIAQQIAIVPEDFHLNPKMVGQLARRAKMGDDATPADWAFGEALAFGSLVLEGTSVRLSGQDSGRGTFSNRHSVLYDTENGKAWVPLSHLTDAAPNKAVFEVFDSSLSEQGVMGFEYGYSTVAMDRLVLWEAQFGDFANGAQVIIDQFIASAFDKWQQSSRLVLLLPHGYEGQGPEHSSARVERYLQLCAENNMQVANCTTPAQYFHLLRRQMKMQASHPLIVITPKSLLRLPAAGSKVEDFISGGFQPVLDDKLENRAQVTRIVLSTGKVYYDMLDVRNSKKEARVALVRLEQIYPFPEKKLAELFASYPNVKEIVWTQEEPKNMGAWSFVKPRLERILGPRSLRYLGRPRMASPATGFYAVHQIEQRAIAEEAVGFETKSL